MANRISRPKQASYGLFRAGVQVLALAAGLAVGGAAEARALRLVALGDSLTAGYGLKPGEAFPDALGRALKASGWDVEVVNAGVSGETAADGLARYDWSVPAGTDALIVELGANDMLQGLDPAAAETALADILAKARDARIVTLLAGMKSIANYGPDYQRRFEAIYPDLAARFGVALYPFFLAGVAGDPAFTLPDGLHPNRGGVEKIVAGILPSVEAALTQAQAQAKP